MKTIKELPHFQIGDSYGGNQDWFPTFMMRIGGCGAETACDSSVYFARYRGLTEIAPAEDPLTKERYIDFAYEMRPYLSPRMSGIDRLDIFIDGYQNYLSDKGESRLTMRPFSGENTLEAARSAVIAQIDNGYLIPTLILNHRNKKYDDYVWHWFLINGYQETKDGEFLVKAVTYSHFQWLNLRELWDTGHTRRGGFVLFHLN